MSRLKAALEALRVHHWAKNVLIFVPLLSAHKLMNFKLVSNGLLAFLAFGLLASSVYVLNDLVDLSADKAHPVKRRRPFASGRLPKTYGYFMLPVLISLSLFVGSYLPANFIYALVTYWVCSTAYSYIFKKLVVWDVIVLASLYTLRIIAGGLATEIFLSEWLLAFSVFFFLSLAFIKRYCELDMALQGQRKEIHRRGYLPSDASIVKSLGSTSGYLAVLVFALYVNSPQVLSLYRHPMWLWLICPLLLYWITRIWILADRSEIHSDTLLFALRDRATYGIGILVVLVLALASGAGL